MGWKLDDLQETLLIGSTLVEGSTLSENEARKVLSGKTVQGHAISEVRELLNYRATVEWFMTEVKKSPYISANLILEFHARLFQGFAGTHGHWKTSENFTYSSLGQRHSYVSPAQVPSLMLKWVQEFNVSATAQGVTKPKKAEIAADLARIYYEFQQIHPFEDGNGRIGRILCAYWLHWKFGKSFVFKLKDKIEHLKALEAANTGNFENLKLFFQGRIQ